MDEETLRSFLSQVQEEFVSRMYELNICATRVEDAAQTMEDSDERSSEGLDNTRPSTAVSATSSSTRTGDLMDIDEADEDRDEEDY